MKTPSAFIVASFIFLWGSISAQYVPMSPELAVRLDGKTRFADIMAEVNTYYKANPNTREEKKWSRWAWFAVRHLNDQGEVDYQTDVLLNIALKDRADLSTDQRSNSGVWSFVGPYNTTWANNLGTKGIGRADRLAFHPTDPNIIYAATPAGGLWRTPDGGNNWFPISSNLPNCGISGIVISEDDPSGNKLYILTGDADTQNGYFVHNFGYRRSSIGILVSYNGGVTWSKSGNSEAVLNGRQCYKILQVRGLPWRMIVATDSGIYATSNFGNTWNYQELVGSTIFDLEQHPTENNIIYAALSDEVQISVNWGGDFDDVASYNPNPGAAVRTALAVTPAQPNEVYFLMAHPINRLYRSTNSGTNFTSINASDILNGNPVQDPYNCAFAINPSSNANMVVGAVNVQSSGNGGVNFGNLTVGIINGSLPTNYIHADIHDLGYHPASNLLYAATDGGIFVSSDHGINWTDKSNGLTCTQYYYMDGVEGTQNLLIGGSQDNGTAYTTNGAIMNYCGSGDGFAVSFVSGDNNVFYQIENDKQYRFTRSTNTRTYISSHNDTTFYSNILAHPANNNIVYLGTANGIWRSDNQGSAWTSISSNGTSNSGSGHTGGLAVTAASPNRLYAANATTMWRYDNLGANVVTISGNPGWPGAFGVITDIACRPNAASEVWVTMTGNTGQNKAFYSSDAGATWTNFTGSLPNVPVYCIAFDDTGDAYVGTELGVFFKDAFMTDWVPFYNGIPFVPVTDLFINETFGTIQAATFGRGIWESDLYSSCGPFLFLSGNVLGENFFQSNGFIETSQVLPGSVGNALRLRSPQRITFEDGFRANQNSYLRAVIGNCGQGVFNLTEEPSTILTKDAALEARSAQEVIK